MDEQSQVQLDNLKNKCIQFEMETIERMKQANEDIEMIEAKIKQLKESNALLTSDIEALDQEYKDLAQKSDDLNREESFAEEKGKLEEARRKNDGLLNQLGALKHRCDLMNDPGYLNGLVMYWTPQAMFKYTQAYNMRSKA